MDVKKDLLEVLEGSKSFLMKFVLKTYQFIDKLVQDHLKMVESS